LQRFRPNLQKQNQFSPPGLDGSGQQIHKRKIQIYSLSIQQVTIQQS
jgi:hypothetical protein